MQITCHQCELARARRLIRRAATTSSTLPVLSHVLIATEDTSIRLCATNLTMGIVALVEAEVAQSGAIAVPARSLFACIEQYQPDECITLRTEELPGPSDSTVVRLVVSDRETFAGMSATAFPPVDAPRERAYTLRLPVRRFQEIVAQVAFAAFPGAADIPDATHALLTNVWLYLDQTAFTLAASDGARCVQRVIPWVKTRVKESDLFLVDARALSSVARSLSRAGEVELIVASNRSLLCVRSESVTFLLRLTGIKPSAAYHDLSGDNVVSRFTDGGKCRPFDPVLPKTWKTLVVMRKKDLQEALRSPKPCICCLLSLPTDEERCLSVSIYREQEVTTRTIPAQVWGPPVPSVWVDRRFLAQALARPNTSSRLVLAWGESADMPIMLRWLDREGGVRPGYSYAFKELNSYRALRHPVVRRCLPDAVQHLLRQLSEQGSRSGEDAQIKRVREEAVFLVGSLLLHALAPTEAEGEQRKARLHQLASRSDALLLDACAHHFDEVVEMLALSAFAPGGNKIALKASGTRLDLDAEAIRAELSKLDEHPAPLSGLMSSQR